jgi:hypothetical protein
VVKVQASIVKVLALLSEMSANRAGTEDRRLVLGEDYVVVDGGVEINAKVAYSKYQMVIRNLGEKPQYPASASFLAALDQYPGAVPVALPTVAKMRNVYRLDAHHMYEVDGITPFMD